MTDEPPRTASRRWSRSRGCGHLHTECIVTLTADLPADIVGYYPEVSQVIPVMKCIRKRVGRRWHWFWIFFAPPARRLRIGVDDQPHAAKADARSRRRFLSLVWESLRQREVT